jgi:hypothetical protein
VDHDIFGNIKMRRKRKDDPQRGLMRLEVRLLLRVKLIKNVMRITERRKRYV